MGSTALAGRVALVTGSGRNIGRAIALGLAQSGAAVVVNGHRDGAALAEVCATIRAVGGRAHSVLADVSQPASVHSMVCEAQEVFGSLEIVVSNVGVRPLRPLLELGADEWDHILAVNLGSAFHLAQAALPGMMQRGHGRFIHLSGLPIHTGRYGQKCAVLASKSGLHGLTKGIADEFGQYGVTANMVAPGMVATERDWTQYPILDAEATRRRIPGGRICTVEDIANACVYLASDGAAFVNGHTLHLNGGEAMF